MATYWHVAQDGWDGNELTSLYAQYRDDAYEMYGERWPDASNLGIYHAHYVHLHETLKAAQEHQDTYGGVILEIEDNDDLEIIIDDLEYPHPVCPHTIPVCNIRMVE